MGYTIIRTMVRGEAIMPVPGGEITGSEIWHTPKPVKINIEEPCNCDDGCEGCKDKE